MIKVYGLKWVPPMVQGLVRDLRLRWALEEAGLAYEEQLVGMEELASSKYRALQPFGQIPVYEEDGFTLDRYKRRCEARPAFHRALQAQLSAYERDEPVRA